MPIRAGICFQMLDPGRDRCLQAFRVLPFVAGLDLVGTEIGDLETIDRLRLRRTHAKQQRKQGNEKRHGRFPAIPWRKTGCRLRGAARHR